MSAWLGTATLMGLLVAICVRGLHTVTRTLRMADDALRLARACAAQGLAGDVRHARVVRGVVRAMAGLLVGATGMAGALLWFALWRAFTC